MGCIWWFILIALFDILLLFRLWALLKPPIVLLVILVTAILGILAIRTRGFRLRPAREAPEIRLINNALIFLAGILLLFPGPLSDLLGVLLLIPPIRERVSGKVRQTVMGQWIGQGKGKFPNWGTGEGHGAEDGRKEGGMEDFPGRKTGRSLGSYPGAGRAKDVDFSEPDSPEDFAENDHKG